MDIYLSKPAGQREGPFTLERIKQDLAAKKYNDTDYWAWYEGLSEWVPLHSVPGITPVGAPKPPAAPAGPVAPKVEPAAPGPAKPAAAAPQATAPKPTAPPR